MATTQKVLAALRAANLPILRYDGGAWVPGYKVRKIGDVVRVDWALHPSAHTAARYDTAAVANAARAIDAAVEALSAAGLTASKVGTWIEAA